MSGPRQRPLVAFYGDDFTGSSENLAQLCRTGLKGRLFFETADPALVLTDAPGLEAVGIAGTSRALAPADMRAVLTKAFGTIRALGTRFVQYKVCSTFDSAPEIGNFATAIETALGFWPDALVPVFAATPDFGRYTAFSNHFSRYEGSVLRLDRNPALVNHPATPMREADLRAHLISLGLPTASAIHAPELGNDLVRLLAERGAGSTPVVIDGLTTDDVVRVAGALWRVHQTAPVFAVGAQGLAQGLSSVLAHERSLKASLETQQETGPVDRMLVLSGSCARQTARQLAAVEAAGWQMIEIPAHQVIGRVEALRMADKLAPSVTAALRSGRSVAAYTARGEATMPADAARTRWLGDLMARLFRRAVTEAGVRRVAVAGGDSSSYAMTSIGADALDIASFDARQSCHVFRLRARDEVDGTEVLLKGGQVGGDDFFLEAMRRP